jgi:3-oxoacyl-[acyl-carrier-protein] synthase II
VKIIFIYPRFEKFLSNNPDIDSGLISYFLADFTTPPSLGIPIMAAWTPQNIEVELIDDNSGDAVNYDAPADLVAINCFTPQATRAFEIADQYRAHGKKVIMGGFFPSFMVDECLKHADSVNIGEVEPTWLQIIDDAKKGALKKKYIGGASFDVSQLKIPKREIFYSKTNYDWDEDLIQLTRGCLYNCAMCAIPAHMGGRIRFRPIDKVIEELKTLKYENVYLADDTLFFPHRKMHDYAVEFFKAAMPLGKKYFVSSTMALNIDKEFLDLAARAGVKNFYCTMNVDPLSIRALQGGQKEQQLLCDLVKTLEDRDIRFFGSFAIGRDWDDTSIADRVIELYLKANIHTSEFFLFTPYPGTVHWDRLERQNRIFDKNWSHYNGAHVVAHHQTMSDEQLYGQFVKVWTEFFKLQKERHVSHLEPSTFSEGKKIVGKPLQRKGVKGQAVITGIGVLSPIGNDPVSILKSLKDARTGLAPITRFDMRHFRTNIGGEIKGFKPEEFLTKDEIGEYDDLYLQYAVAAARRAIKDAGINQPDPKKINYDIALVLGTCNGGLLSAENEYRWKHGKGGKVFNEKENLQAQLYGFAKAMAHALGIGGEIWLVTTACSSTTGALGLAQLLINKGYYKTVITGGSDSLCIANVSGFNAIKALSTGVTAPFSLPEGLNIGEAACFTVIEEMESALLRNARCLGKLVGHATSCDAYHPTSPDPRGDGAFRTLRDALSDAGLDIKDIGCINAHGTGTGANDRAESKGISKLIGENKIPVISLKSFFGHCMGTTGILEMICNLQAMNDGFIPPTINFSEPRPGCSLDYVPNKPRSARYSAFLSSNYAFGGNNAAIAVAQWDAEIPARNKKQERVVITGVGTVTSLGLGVDNLINRLTHNDVGIAPISRLELAGMKSNLAGLVSDFSEADVDRRLNFRDMNPISRFATAAARLALESAQLKVTPKNAENVGIVMGICNGSDEAPHMDSVFKSDTLQADIASFSNAVANSTAGWVANALSLKGVNSTLSPGPHAGMQALTYAYNILSEGRANHLIAAAADEIYPQSYFNYNLMEYLYQDDKEKNFKIRLEEPKRKVIGEGSAALVIETLTAAKERNAPILGEVLGYGMAADPLSFSNQCLSPDALMHAVNSAINRAKVDINDVDLIVWAPQGNGQDKPVVDVLHQLLG